jgi:hypothetical protein
MDTATLTPTPRRLALVRGLLRPTAAPAAEGHLHFDRQARSWRRHDEPSVGLEPVALPECA